MIGVSELKRAVEEALSCLKSVPDVKEAEVFVAVNGNLLTRLNYTSHIPCNGLEEPKSTESYGVGIQAVFQTPEGIKVGFGSEPGNIEIEGVKRALEKARKGAVVDPEFRSLPIPAGEQPSPENYHDPELMKLQDRDLVEAGWKVINGALETFSLSPKLFSLAGGEEKLRDLGLILGGDVTLLQERVAVGSSNLSQVRTDESTLIMAFVTAMIEGKESKGSGWTTATHLEGFPGKAGEEAAENAIRSIDGRRIEGGEYRVIFGRQPIADLFNNLVLPSLSLDNFYAATSTFLGNLGQQVVSEKLTIYDHGYLQGFMGSKGITCEGLPTGKTELIRSGVLVGLLSNYYEMQRILNDPQAREKLGVDPQQNKSALTPRNGFRFARGGGRNFDVQPGIFPTNIVVEGTEELSLEDLLKEVGEGIYIGRIWYTYPVNGLRVGDFTCTVIGDSYLIRDGKLEAPLKPNTVRINDNVHKVLNNVIGLSRDRKETLVWAADEVVYTPEIAVEGVRLDAIASFMEEL